MPPVPRTPERETDALRFAAAMISKATVAGILTPASQGLRGAENYMLFSHASSDPRYAAGHPPIPHWQECATLLGRYQLVVASGDYGVFDAVVHDDPQAENERVTAAARYLADCLRQPHTPLPPPNIRGSDLVAALGREYQDIIRSYAPRAHPRVLQEWRDGLIMLLDGMARYRTHPHPTFPFEIVRGLAAGTLTLPAAERQVADRYGDAMPTVLLQHLTMLMASADPDPDPDPDDQDQDQLLLLLRAAEEGNTIGAGMLLKSLALHGSPDEVTEAALRALNDVAWLANYRTRIGNHRSDIHVDPAMRESSHEDHSGERVWYCLLSDKPGETFADHDLSPDTARYLTQACQRAEDWLAEALADSVRALWSAWPWVGAACCRLCHVGHRPYDIGHYAHLTRAQYAALFDELDYPEQTPFLARCHPTWNPTPAPAAR